MGYNFAHVVDTIATQSPDRTAILCVDPEGQQEVTTYGSLRQATNRFADGLRQLGIKKADRVLIVLPRCTESFVIYLALLKLGATAIPGSEMLRAADIKYRLNHSGAIAVFAHSSLAGEVDKIREECKSVKHCAVVGEQRDGWIHYTSILQSGQNEDIQVPTADEDAAFLLYTSGTTGGPKGVLHGYSWPREHLKIAGTYWLDPKPNEVIWATAAPGWGKWIWSPFVTALGNGATSFVYKGRFDPKTYLDLMEKYQIQLLCATPTEYRLMAKVDDLASYKLSLRTAVSAGEPLNREAIDRFKEAFGVTLRDGYGQTESSLAIANLINMELKPGSLGKPFPGMRIAIVDDNGCEVLPGTVGHIALHKSFPPLFKGYLNDEERTRKAFRGDWFITGDLGSMDGDGYFYFEGRADDIIISSGYTIGPSEVEDALVKHPKVLDCAVVASPDKERGHIVKAFVILKDPADRGGDESSLVRELQDHVKRLTAPYKYPRAIEFVDALPRTTNGKIQRAELRKREAERAQAISSL
ncbi:AMP-binding protein [Alicyclobacillus tolerans]|uniref:acyl-CoA synthetase n=1 Tax=Alicyclobacillus tolerans TaxID=90970 RepID=UPI001F312295|nr:AMP-binding protein [Alicyclobacillus tolerans]MCF8567462.1 AMP-binding protein [Alicyclobacillus tolerans]